MKVVYLIPCSCGTPYVGGTRHSIYQRIQEHTRDLRNCRTHFSALVKHAKLMKHHIHLEDSKVLAGVHHFHHRKLTEVLEIEKRINTLNRDDGWKINSLWVPSLYS